MIRRTVTSLIVLFLSACGADGEGQSSGTGACSSNSNCGVSSGGSVNSSDAGECQGATDCSHCPETPLGVCIEGQCRDYDSALGCALPAECIDADDDGYPLDGCEGRFPADCDDSEPRARPNQRAFFPSPTAIPTTATTTIATVWKLKSGQAASSKWSAITMIASQVGSICGLPLGAKLLTGQSLSSAVIA